MQREPHALPWDICQAADAVPAFTRGKGLADNKEDSLLRSAVERQLIIPGEAIVQLSKLSPEFADRIPEQQALRVTYVFEHRLFCQEPAQCLKGSIVADIVCVFQGFSQRVLKGLARD
jgi:uncharacterized protein with HEPN domain